MIGKKLSLLLVGALVAMPLMHARGDGDDEGKRGEEQDTEGRVRRGFALSPVPLNLEGRDRALVGLGSYLVNGVAGCTDCHTHPEYAPGGDPYQGQPKQINAAHFLGGGRQFFGPVISRNLTPESPSGNPAGLTFAQFSLVLRTGIDLDHAHPQFGPLLQVMPWSVYQGMTDQDLRAIYEYLSSIPHAEPGSVGP